MKKINYLIISLLILIPTITFADSLPSKYDLRNVNGKSYVTPPKDQGNEGLCWDYGAVAHLESRVLIEENKPYDSSATIFSEKQTVYAAGAVITNGRRAFNKYECQIDHGYVGNGGGFSCASEPMLDGLGAVSKTWDEENKAAIENNNAKLDSDIVYNFTNSRYELNSTIEYPNISLRNLNNANRTKYLNTIKNFIMTYGGGAIGTDVGCQSRAIYDGKDVMIVGAAADSASFYGPMDHAMQVIGWDDNYEYKICKHATGYAYPPDDCPDDYFSGKGVWIVKNSWADIDENTLESLVLVAYDTYTGFDFSFFKDLSKKNWDNFYQLDSDYINSNSRLFFFKDNEYITDEIINKIKIKLLDNTNYKIYYSEYGDSIYTLIGEINTDKIEGNSDSNKHMIGYYYLDLASKAYHINNRAKFKIIDGYGNYSYDFRVYTNNVNNNFNAHVEDVTFDKSKNTGTSYTFVLDTNTKNIDDSEIFTYKIKKPNNSYVSTNSYSYEYNKVYANINSTKFTLKSSEFTNGTYTIETYYNGSLLYSSPLLVKGGTSSDTPEFGLPNLVRDDNKKVLKNIDAGVTVKDFFDNTINNESVKLYSKDNVLLDKNDTNTLLATGQYVKFNDGGELTYRISVKGDVNGDGKVNSKDYVKIRKHIMESTLITGDEYISAADYNSDNQISSKDYVKVRKYLMSF